MSDLTLLSSTRLLWILVGATLLLVLSRRWRLALLALEIHYLALGGLMLNLGLTARAGLRILIGGLICMTLFLTVRHLVQEHGDDADPLPSRQRLSDLVFKLSAASLALIGVFGSPLAARFSSLPAEFVQAAVWLAAVGVVIILVSRRPLWIGIGCLTLASGLGTLYTALNPHIVVAGLVSVGELLLTFAITVAIIRPRASP